MAASVSITFRYDDASFRRAMQRAVALGLKIGTADVRMVSRQTKGGLIIAALPTSRFLKRLGLR